MLALPGPVRYNLVRYYWRMEMAPTIKELAKACELTPLTVSRALRGDSLVAHSTCKRVQGIAEQMGYTANILARQLKSGRTFMIGIMLNDYSSEFVGRMVQGAQHCVVEADFDIVTLEWTHVQQDVKPFVERVCGKRLEGLLMCQWGHGHEVEFFSEISRRDIPVVAIDREADLPGIPFVGTDDAGGAEQAVRHLIDMGHRKIGHITGTPLHSSAQRRLMGFYETMSAFNLPVHKSWVVKGDYRYDGAAEACQRFFAKNDELPTAIFAGSDLIAAVFIQVAMEHGLRVPDDISVVGFSDEAFAKFVTPPITSISSSPEDMGAKGAEVLLQMIENNNNDKPEANHSFLSKKILLPVELIERRSVKRI